MKIEKIEWKFKLPDHSCKCIACNGGQAEFIAHTGNWYFCVCLDCSKLDETELMKRITGGQTNETSALEG